ncbi:MAG: SHOCT domain-containing protein, partial [Actinobacteria bacterium]|nr:SHOCT domain-containing protein [Actinomycetota bacterium]
EVAAEAIAAAAPVLADVRDLVLVSEIRSVAAEATPTDEIVRAKQLLDAGAITDEEYASLKAAALTKARA